MLILDYLTLDKLESEIIEEARRHDSAQFQGAVGKIEAALVMQSLRASFEVDDENRIIIHEHEPDSSMDTRVGSDSERLPRYLCLEWIRG